jgi:flagellar basal-body rod modification protein FlgD
MGWVWWITGSKRKEDKIMQIASVGASSAVAGASGDGTVQINSSTSSKSDDFMKLLLAQLTHQNPMEPLKDNEMLSQYAQLNSVQELQSIHTVMNNVLQGSQVGYAASLIGKVAKINKSDGKQIEGVVTGVTISSDQIMVQIGKDQAPLANVVQIKGA